MESALRPREIQARVRAGESLEEVALAAGVPAERVEPYAAPVFAERAYIAQQAQEAPVRRRGETSSTRSLLAAVTERLTSRGVERGDVEWDAWKLEGRRWNIQADYLSDSAEHKATFTYDQSARFSVATNDDAQWLIGDEPPSDDPPRRNDPDAEPTLDLDDELAIVRAVDVERYAFDDTGETVDAYTPGDLEEVDGVYDIVPPSSDMDLLYDMLSSFNEDSVQIYRGLTTPVVVGETPSQWTHESDPVPPDEDLDTPPDSNDSPPVPLADSALTTSAATSPETERLGASGQDSSQAPPEGKMRPERAEPRPSLTGPDPAADETETSAAAREQEVPAPAPRKKPAQRRSRKRASVPSWDEIMFGSRTPPKDQG